MNTYNIEINSINDIDLSAFTLPLIVIYKNPKDIPNKYVGRIWDIDIPTNVCIIRDTLEELRKEIPSHMIRCRSIHDDDCIVETWI